MRQSPFMAFLRENAPILWQIPGPLLLIGSLLVQGKFLFWGTAYLQFLPWRLDAWQQLSSGILPLWSDQVGMGAPLFANYQSALLYPPNLLIWMGAACCSIKGIAVSQTILVMLHLIVSGIGMVYLIREIGFGKLAQTICGLSFSLSGYLISRASFLSMNAVLAWLPWLLWCSLRWMRALEMGNRKEFGKYVGFHLIILAFQLLGGHAQLTWYTQLMIVVWVLIFTLGGKKEFIWKKLATLGLISLIAIGLCAVQLVPTAEYLLQSQRSQAVDESYALNYSFWPWRLLTLFSPDLFGNPGRNAYWVTADNYWEDAVYIGFIPVILAFYGLFNRRKGVGPYTNNQMAVRSFAIGFILLGVFLGLGKNTPLYPFLYRFIPTFNLFQAPARFSIWFVVGLVLLIGFGLDRWVKPTGRRLYWSRLGAMAGFGAILTALIARTILDGSIEESYLNGAFHTSILFFGLMIFNLFAPEKGKPVTIWNNLLILFVLGDLLFAHSFINPGIPLKTLDLVKPIETENAHRIYLSPQDESQLKFNHYFRFDTFLPAGRWINLPSAFIPNSNILQQRPAVNNFDPFTPRRFSVWMDEVMGKPGLVNSDLLRYLDVDMVEEAHPDTGAVSFFEVDSPSRYHFFTCAEMSTNEIQSLSKVIAKMESGQILSRVILENPLTDSDFTCRPADENLDIHIQVNQSNQHRIELITTQPGWLMQSDIWYPGWKAFLDGQAVPLERMDFAFRGIYIPEGKHEIQLDYQPLSFRYGLWISILSLIVLVTLLFLLKRWSKANGRTVS